MNQPSIRSKLEEVQTWAQDEIKKGEQPPWIHFYCQKLNETCCQLLHGWEHPLTPAPADSLKVASLEDAQPRQQG